MTVAFSCLSRFSPWNAIYLSTLLSKKASSQKQTLLLNMRKKSYTKWFFCIPFFLFDAAFIVLWRFVVIHGDSTIA